MEDVTDISLDNNSKFSSGSVVFHKKFGQGKVEMFNGLVEGSTIRQTARWHCVLCIEGLLLDLTSGSVGGDLFVFRCR